MKVAQTVASVSRNAGGLFDAVRRLSLSLHMEQGTEVHVYSLEDEYTGEDLNAWAPLVPRTFPVWGPRDFGYSRSLGKALARARVDVLHAHGIWMFPSVASMRWTKANGGRHVVSLHGMVDRIPLGISSMKKIIARRLFEDSHLKGASCLHALTASEVRSIREYGLKNPVCVIPNGVDIPQGTSIGHPPWSEVVEEGHKVLLYLGRLHPIKGLPGLLEAWSMVDRGIGAPGKEWELVIAGWDQGGHAALLDDMARSAGLKRIHLLGPQYGDHKASAFRRASGFVLPSSSEALPMAVLEAWSYGLPVLMTGECNLPGGFDADAAIGITSKPESIAQGIRALISMTEDQRKAMGENGKNLVRNSFSWPAIASNMHRVYEWIAGGGAAPDCVVMN